MIIGEKAIDFYLSIAFLFLVSNQIRHHNTMNTTHIKAQIARYEREIGQILSHYPRIAETLFPRILADRRRKILKLKSLSKQ